MMMLARVSRRSKRCRILLVEDEVLIRALAADELRSAGFDVVEAASADEAIACFEAGETPDLLFSDINMPGRHTGLDLAGWTRRQFPSLPIILASAYQGTEPIDPSFFFIPKPYSLRHVIELARRLLGSEDEAKDA